MLGRKEQETKPNTGQQTEEVLRRKGLTLIVSFSLLVVLVIAGTVAWYTRITNVTGLTMNVAQFDFTADYVAEDFIIDVSDYLNVENGKAAPGTGGVIPILVSAGSSDTAVEYSLNVDTTPMAPEFRQRIRYFYYTTDANGAVQEVTIQKGSQEITGTLAVGTSCYEYIYWEWVYTLDNDLYYDTSSGLWTSSTTEFTKEQVDAFDKFDTQIALGKLNESFTDTDGKTWEKDEGASQTAVTNGVAGEIVDHPLLAYQKAMEAKLNISGAQAKPVTGSDETDTTAATGMTVRKPTTATATAAMATDTTGSGTAGAEETE